MFFGLGAPSLQQTLRQQKHFGIPLAILNQFHCDLLFVTGTGEGGYPGTPPWTRSGREIARKAGPGPAPVTDRRALTDV